MSYQLKDLEEVKTEYRENFERLILSIGTPDHEKYADIEDKLFKKEKAIMKALGVYVESPCPPQSTSLCWECSGYYRQSKRKKNGRRFEECREDASGAIRCFLSYKR